MYKTLLDIIKSVGLKENIGIIFIDSDSDELFISYKYLYENALNVLYNLQLIGVESGQELLFQIGDNKEFLEVFWACILGGIIPVPIPVGDTEEDKEKVVNVWKKLKNPCLITNSKIWTLFQEYLQDKINNIEDNVVFLEDIRKKQGLGMVCDVSENDIAYIQFSSGSTGNPKGVILTHENILVNINDMINSANVTATDSTLSWMPLTHDTGLIAFHMVPLVANINQYIMPTFLFIMKPLLWFKKANDHQITILSSPNFGYKHFLDHFNPEIAKGWELSNVRIIMNGAEPINDKLCKVFLNIMAPFNLKNTTMFPAYGLAEASVAVTLPLPEKQMKTVNIERTSILTGEVVNETEDKEKGVSFVEVGYPIANCNLRICDDKNRILNENIIGHIQIKGKNVTSGYYNDINETQNVFTVDGWLKTGDLGFMRNRSLVVTGRAKDIIFVNGQNYYPQDIENVVMNTAELELKDIAACSVLDNKSQREDIILFIRYNNNLESFGPIATLLKDKVSKKIGFPIKFVIPIKQIPKTASGKVQRYKLAEQYKNGEFHETVEKLKELTATKYIAPKNDTEEKLALIWQDILDLEKVSTKDNFFDLGGDSLKAVRLVSRLVLEFDVNMNDIYTHQTISSLAENIHHKKNYLKIKVEHVKDKMAAAQLYTCSGEIEKKNITYNESIKKYGSINYIQENNYKNVLITGATGYLGSHLLIDVLENTNYRVYLIIRGNSLENAAQRLNHVLNHYFEENILTTYQNRIVILNGDLTKENLGLKAEEYDKISNTVDCIINSAAYVKHYGQYNEFYEINVRGTQRLIDLALTGKKKDFNHVSTIGVGTGYIKEKDAVLFTEYDCNIEQHIDNYYFKTKLESEEMLLNAMDNGLNVNMFRVGNIVFNSQNGIFQKNINDNAFYKSIQAIIKLKQIPDINLDNIDFSFVDYVARAIILLFNKFNFNNEIVHIYNPNRVSLVEVGRLLSQSGYDIDVKSAAEFVEYLYHNYDEKTTYIENLMLHTRMFDDTEQTDFHLACDKTDLILSKLGFTWCDINEAHIQKMMNYCKNVGFIE